MSVMGRSGPWDTSDARAIERAYPVERDGGNEAFQTEGGSGNVNALHVGAAINGDVTMGSGKAMEVNLRC